MDIRIITTVFFLFLSSSIHAEVYKCLVNGNTVFSDKSCANNAEKIDIQVYQPKSEDIKQQQRTTQRYQEDSKHNELLELRKQNKSLKAQIVQLQKQRDAELKALEQKTYRYSDTRIASTERGVFKKMREVSAEYQARIQQIEVQIKQSENKITQLQFDKQ